MLMKLISIVLFLSVSSSYAYEAEYQNYTYKVRRGDTLSEITLMFTGNLNYKKVARANRISNPDLIFPGNKIILITKNPISVIGRYFEAIYDNRSEKAYEMLSSYTKSSLSLAEFDSSIKQRTAFDMTSFEVISDTIWDKHLVLFIEAHLESDPAKWGFNVIREKGKWRVLVLNHNPTFPQQLIGVPEE